MLAKSFVVLSILFWAVFIPADNFYEKYQRDQRDIKYFESTYQRQQGWSQAFGKYDLRTFDGGKNWYAVTDTDKGVTILGTAEEIHPGLLAHNAGMDALLKSVKQNGPVDISNPDQLKLLTNAGFSISKK
jgi:hypothetical protein